MKNRNIQILIVLLLASMPVIMIFINGSRAFNGILGNQNIAFMEKTSHDETPTSFFPLSRIDYGVYDPQATLEDLKIVRYEMIYLSWLDINSMPFEDKLSQIRKRNRIPVITVEAWPKNQNNLMTEILNGGYDVEINALTNLISKFGDTVWISWGHEMDQDLTKRYPWSGQAPAEFQNAFRYIHDKCMKVCDSKVRWIWAPVAKTGSMKYYPGDDYVDAIGLPVYAFPEWENSFYGYIKSFEETFKEKSGHVKTSGKPVFITEFGISGSDDFESFWLRNAFQSFEKFELLQAVFFFQATETPGVWGEHISAPDWKLPATTIESMIQWAKSE